MKELIDMSQRLKVAKMLDEKVNYLEIGSLTGMSSATISRINRCLEYGNNGYKTVIERLKKS